MTLELRCLSMLAAGLLALVRLSTTVSAAPLVTIRGEAQIRLTKVSYSRGHSVISGTITDAVQHRGLARRLVRLTVRVAGRPLERLARSDGQGRFHFVLPLPADVYVISLGFTGDRFYASTAVQPRIVDISKPTVDLHVELPRELDASQRSQKIGLDARSGGTRIAIPVMLYAGKRFLARLTTRTDQRLSVALATSALGRPGRLVLTFRFPGNANYNAAQRQLDTILSSKVSLTLSSPRRRVDADQRILLRGSIQDLLGPIVGATVSVNAMGRHAASTLSGHDGRFTFELPAEEFPPGALDLAAEFTPAVVWRRPASSPPLQIQIAAPRPIPFRVYAIPAAGTLLLVGLLFGWRFRAQLARRGAVPREGTASPARLRQDALPPVIASGAQMSRSRHLRRQDFGIAGVVWDPIDKRPIAGASVVVTMDDGPRFETHADHGGNFALEDLPGGSCGFVLSRPGYVRERFAAQLPHRGNLRGLRVDLVPVRVRILELYRQSSVGLLPRPHFWARWTPRDLLAHLAQQRREDPALEQLSRLLEQAYWSERLAKEEDLERAEHVAQTIAQTTRPSGSSQV